MRHVVLAIAVLLLALAAALATMMIMPGRSFRGPAPPARPEEEARAARLRQDVEVLASAIGPRHPGRMPALDRAAAHVEKQLRAVGLPVEMETFAAAGRGVSNVVAHVVGAEWPDQIVVVGAHYDSVPESPGADDNASGTAALLELARAFAGRPTRRTLRFVGFVNEEPPYSYTEEMGSLVHARAARRRGERVVAMLSLESIGYFRDEPGSQKYPAPFSLFYPDRADFVAFVGNLRSRALVRRTIAAFRRAAEVPSEGGALPAFVPGVGWSDHWSFWQAGYPAVMVTGTALFRNPHYHTPGDRAETLDYLRLARTVAGLEAVVRELVE